MSTARRPVNSPSIVVWPWILATICVAVIVYLSLFPFEFLPQPKVAELAGLRGGGSSRRFWLDLGLNVLLYVPLGALVLMALRSMRGWAIPAAVLLSAGLSFSVEQMQRWLPSRYATWTDFLANTLGAAIGATLVWFALRWRFDQTMLRGVRERGRMPTPSGLAFLSLWILWQGVPLMPRISWPLFQLWVNKMTSSEAWWPLAWHELTEAALSVWLLTSLLRGSHGMPLVFLIIPAQLFLLDRQPTPELILGAAAGFLISWELRSTANQPSLPDSGEWRLLGAAWTAWMIFEEFRPFQFDVQPVEFAWLPGLSMFSPTTTTYQILVGKLFLYAAVVISINRRMSKSAKLRWPAVGIPALILVVGEWAQTRLVGRTPESTDLFLLALGALIVWFAGRSGEYRKISYEQLP